MQEKVLEILSQEVTNFQKLSDKLKEVVVDFDARSLKSILKYKTNSSFGRDKELNIKLHWSYL